MDLPSRSPTTELSAAPAPRGHWDWRRLTELAFREAAQYLSQDDAADAAQEAALRAWRRAHTCSGAPEAWLRVIARNEALRLATKRREEALPEEYDSPTQPGEAPSHERLEIFAALATLNTSEQQTILLRYWSDKTDAQIAAMLSMPVGTVKVRLHRARQKLALALAETDERPEQDA